MADKPEQDQGLVHADALQSSAKTPRKPKGSATIDLAPAELSEIKAAAPASETSPEMQPTASEAPSAAPETEVVSQPPSAESQKAGFPLMAGLVGLIAGAAGGFGAYQAMPILQPKPTGNADPALVQRLDSLEKSIAARPVPVVASGPDLAAIEKRLAEAQAREGVLRAEITKLAAALATEAEARKAALAALPATGAPGVAVDAGALDAIRKDLAALGGRVDGGLPRLERLQKEIEAVTGRLAQASGREALGAAHARLAAAALLEDAAAKGRPLAEAIDLIRGLGGDATRLASLAPFAESGVPNTEKLLAEWRAIKPPAPQDKPKPEQGLLDRIRSGAAGLIEVRRAGDVTGTDDAAQIARAEQALQRGDLAAALALAGRLTPQRAGDYAAWRNRTQAVIAAREAIGALKNDALAALARAGAAK